MTTHSRHHNADRHPKSIAQGHSALVLGGGPDAEREVSLISSRAVADALESGGIAVTYEVIDTISASELARLGGDVVVPILHGPFGEGGQLQDVLERDGRPYIGCGPIAARQAMDKIATKLAAARIGVPTAPAAIFNPADSVSSIELPVVLKPVHEGSSVGVHLCHTRAAWAEALPIVREDKRIYPDRTYMIERLIAGTEITVGVLDPAGTDACALPPIEIRPAVEFYDYEAKYNRDDTQYIVDPPLPGTVKDDIQRYALALARELGVRHLCRVDFLLDHEGRPWLLEVNTMPGFTGHSLLPMAANHIGLDMPRLTATLMSWAARDRRPMN
ncbi:MAG TPA: D-alanine--D-alanine ligase [Phycisphaerales bacterium]|nr:D-alanine--D-alanine ligase [Phycisphaerales bacterium]